LFSSENEFSTCKRSNQAIYSMSLGSLYYIWGLKIAKRYLPKVPKGPLEARSAADCPSGRGRTTCSM